MAWIRSTKKQIIVHLIKTGNWRVQKIAFLFMLKAALHSLYIRWWLTNVKCQSSNLVSDSSDQKLSVVPSLASFLELTYLEIQVRARNIMMADAQTDYLNDYWTHCKTATRNLSGDLVEVLRLVIHTAQKFLQNAYAMKSSLFSRNVAWCLQVKRTLVREISQLIWTIYPVFVKR